MQTDVELAVVRRPNGKVYRARKPPCIRGYDTDGELDHWCAVMRTHDVDYARRVARPFVTNCIDIANPELVWLRESIREGEPWIEHDPIRGVPAVVFLELDL